MSQRDKLIDERARSIFERENADPNVSWGQVQGPRPSRSAPTRVALGEGERKIFRDRAERELIAEGLIDPV